MKRRGIAILQNICALVAGGLAGFLLFSSHFVLETPTGKYIEVVYPWTIDSANYTDSYLFQNRMLMDMRGIIRDAVIKSQMETDGVYDGKKEISIYTFVNRKEGQQVNWEWKGSPRYYLEDLVKWSEYGFEFIHNDELSFPILKERYQTADGRNILDFVNSEEQYEEYVMILQNAAAQLDNNYQEYKSLEGAYAPEKTNLRYCLKSVVYGETEYFDNIPDEISYKNDENLDTYFGNLRKYGFYAPKTMELQTNMLLDTAYYRDYLNQYEYIFNEDSKIWIGVDTTYPVQDGYYLDSLKYNDLILYYFKLLIGIAVFIVLYVGLLIFGTFRADGLYGIDGVPFEVLAGGGGLLELFFLFGFAGMIDYYFNYNLDGSIIPSVGICIIILLSSIVFLSVYYSFVRRCKARIFWESTLLGRCMKWLVGIFTTSGNIVIRIWIPYFAFLIINFILVVMMRYSIIFPLIAFVMDMVIGVLLFIGAKTKKHIEEGMEKIAGGEVDYQLNTVGMYGENLTLAKAVNKIGDGIKLAVETSMKDERMKADLITNVSHDIKTPLTSIINYVDLIKRENIENDKIKGYVEILDNKSQRLKQLTEDLVEASKISSGNIEYRFEQLNFVELVHQTLGEFSEKFEEKQLQVVAALPKEPVYINADSRRIWRVVENLYNNIYKYAMPGTRIYLDMEIQGEQVMLSVKNISAQTLNINAEELTERFIRGDISRSTEGSGLGLSIAKNLTEAQQGKFDIYLDGDLFKVTLTFPVVFDSTLE